MAIGTLDKESFVEILRRKLSPSSPIQSHEDLHGRHVQLREIEQALASEGRSVFIYGDRGVGKTSLAHTAAFEYKSSESDPIFKSCSKDTTFFSIVESIASSIINNPLSEKFTHETKAGIALKGISLEAKKCIASGNIPSIKDINTAVDIIRYLAETKKGNTIVVLDEFDLMGSAQEKELFAEFLKQVGDRKIDIKFIVCGIGKSLEELLCAHNSCYRYLANIKLPRLYWDARWEIIDRSAKSLGVRIDEKFRYRIAAISDGFPHYVHLLCEKIYWEMFWDDDIVTDVSPNHYTSAITNAIKGIEQQLKNSYEMAIMRAATGYEEILWAAADRYDLIRNVDDVYSSYLRIMDDLEEEPLDRASFMGRLGTFKKERNGGVLISNRTSWYEFKESIMRGYVRLRAEEKGAQLALDYTPEGEVYTQKISISTSKKRRGAPKNWFNH